MPTAFFHTLPRIQHAQLAGFPIGILRWDENDALISGNKAEKLAWQIELTQTLGFTRFASLGGAWSNHLHAIGALCHEKGWKLDCIVRGEVSKQPSPLLNDLQRWGASVHYCDRTHYRLLRNHSAPPSHGQLTPGSPLEQHDQYVPGTQQIDLLKASMRFLDNLALNVLKQNILASFLKEQWYQHVIHDVSHSMNYRWLRQTTLDTPLLLPSYPEKTWWIPEGGNHALAILSIAAWTQRLVQELRKKQETFNAWIVSMGTGATFRGILLGLSFCEFDQPFQLIGVPAFRSGPDLFQEIRNFANTWTAVKNQKNFTWTLWQNAHWGGFGKYPSALATQHAALEAHLETPLDRVYTLKSAIALEKNLANPSDAFFTPNRPHPLFIHTGGLQGNRSVKTELNGKPNA